MESRTSNHMPGLLALSCVFISLATMTAGAEESGGFMACGQVATDVERLACYDHVYEERLQEDKVVMDSEKTEEKHSPAPVEPVPISELASDTPAIEQAQAEAVFGFPRSTYPDELKSLRSGVIKLERNSRGRAVFYLENGQVWLQMENRRFLIPDEPLMADVVPGMFGAFFLTLEGNKQRTKVKRIR